MVCVQYQTKAQIAMACTRELEQSLQRKVGVSRGLMEIDQTKLLKNDLMTLYIIDQELEWRQALDLQKHKLT
jgi:hypothetical protein